MKKKTIIMPKLKSNGEIEIPKLKTEVSISIPKLKPKYYFIKRLGQLSYVVSCLMILLIIYGSYNLFSYGYSEINTEIAVNELDDLVSNNDINNIITEKVIDNDVSDDITLEDNKISIDSYRKNDVIDFDRLKEINSEIVGWIYINGTKINYPVLQHDDNEYYLKNDIYSKSNRAGWIFMDYRNDFDNQDGNTIIYGHNMNSGSMFGTLKKTLKKQWYTNGDNQIITFFTENKIYRYQVFSIYHLKNTTDYLNIYNDDSFIKMIKDRSIYDFDIEVDANDRILTLSTCYSSKEKLVVHAKLLNI